MKIISRVCLCALGLSLAAAVIELPGCSQQELTALQQEKQVVDQELSVAQQNLSAAQSIAATQPSASAAKALATATDVVNKAQQASTALQGVIGEIQTGSVGDTATISALSLIPGVGPYAGLIAAVVGLVYGLWQRQSKITQANQLAAAVHADAGSSNVTQALAGLGYTAPPATAAPATASTTAAQTPTATA